MKVYLVVDGVAVGERDVSKTKASMLKSVRAKKHVATYDPRVDPPRQRGSTEAIQEGDVVVVTTK